MPPEPSVTSASERPRRCTLRYSSALLAKSFDRPGPKAVSPATYSSGVKLVIWCRWISVCFIVVLLSDLLTILFENRRFDLRGRNFDFAMRLSAIAERVSERRRRAASFCVMFFGLGIRVT